MTKTLTIIPFILFVGGCASQMTPASKAAESNDNDDVVKVVECKGDTQLPVALLGKLDIATDPALLANAIRKPGEGGLCQGQVYQVKAGETITVYRIWNSRNNYSKTGRWWVPTQPLGNERSYRDDFGICYTWSPLDKLLKCQLKAGTKVVVGSGQSVSCPPANNHPKTYVIPASAQKQLYIENAKEAVVNCVEFDNEFSWIEAKGQ